VGTAGRLPRIVAREAPAGQGKIAWPPLPAPVIRKDADDHADGRVAVSGQPDDQEQDAPEVWFTLEHEPGPAWRHDLPPLGQDFTEHFAFISLLRERGLLVAGGPRPDDPGHGMLVIRGVDEAGARQLATRQDMSVVHGLLRVTVRPWLIASPGG
jgi:uncharacterized protein YciI